MSHPSQENSSVPLREAAAAEARDALMKGRGADELVRVRGLVKHSPVEGSDDVVRAVDGVTFEILSGETLGLVGESGCGKTTVGRCLLRLIEPTAGRVTLRVHGQTSSLLDLDPPALKKIRPHMQMVFQDPQSSLNARMTVGDLIGEPLVVNRLVRGQERTDRVVELLK